MGRSCTFKKSHFYLWYEINHSFADSKISLSRFELMVNSICYFWELDRIWGWIQPTTGSMTIKFSPDVALNVDATNKKKLLSEIKNARNIWCPKYKKKHPKLLEAYISYKISLRTWVMIYECKLAYFVLSLYHLIW